MNTNACETVMYWDSENLVDSFRFFKQRSKLYFSVKNIPAEKQVDHILLLAGEEGLRRYNAWTFENDSDRADPELFGVNLRSDSNLKLISVLHDFICVNISRRTQKILTISLLGANYRPKNANLETTRKLKNGSENRLLPVRDTLIYRSSYYPKA